MLFLTGEGCAGSALPLSAFTRLAGAEAVHTIQDFIVVFETGVACRPTRTAWRPHCSGVPPTDGHTTPFSGGWQAGVLVDHVFAKRPASSFSLGAGTAILSQSYRISSAAAGTPLLKTETIIEATYKDEIMPGLSLKPDLQYVLHPSADPRIRNALLIGLRVQFDFKLR